MEPDRTDDPKPSGAAFSAPWDLSYELHLLGSQLLAGIYASLHPVNVLVAALAMALVGGATWLVTGEDVGAGGFWSEGASAGFGGAVLAGGGPGLGGSWSERLWAQTPVAAAHWHVLPWWRLAPARGGEFWRQLLVCGWGLAVWSWAATLICRSTALRLLRVDFRWLDVFHFSNRHFLDAMFSILIPLFAVVGLSLPVVLVGGLLVGDGLSVVGSVLALLLGPLGLLTGLLLVGLTLSWPLMFPALAVEGRDSFESISRAYAYLLQRPVTLLALVLAGVFVGSLVTYLIECFFYFASTSYAWGLAWGANAWQAERLVTVCQPTEADSTVLRVWTGPWLRTLFAGFGRLNLAAQQAVFWGLAVAIYLLMRRALDQTPLDEIYQPGRNMLKPLV